MDIYIIYGRIQVLYPKLKLFAKTSISRISLGILAFCFIINIPINLSRDVVKIPLKIESNKTTIFEAYGNNP